MMNNPLDNLLKELSRVEALCLASPKKADELSLLLKSIFDHATEAGCKVGSVDELIVSNLDAETIWEELHSRNVPLVRSLSGKIGKLNGKIEQLLQDLNKDVTDEDSKYDEESIENDGNLEDNSEDDNVESIEDGENEENNENTDDDEEDGGIEFGAGSDNESDELNENDNEGHYESDMEKWLDDMDEDEMRRMNDNYESDEDDVYVSNALYEDKEEGNADYRYDDYFKDEQEERDDFDEDLEEGDEDEDLEDDNEEGSESDKADYDEETEDNHDKDPVKGSVDKLTAHQAKTQRLANQITELETQLMKDKAWSLKGEVKAGDRPENSLLETYADIERLSKPTPVITETSTNDLESIIKDRIKNNRFNDIQVNNSGESNGERKSADNFELSQEKNTTGLGELYAQEFLAKSLNSVPEAVSNKISNAREDALALFHKVSMRLDELSHFFFAPRPVTAEINVKTFAPVTALPSVNLEEVIPTIGSTASQFAPEEVMEKKRGRQGNDLTKADKKKFRKLNGRDKKAANDANSDNEQIHDKRVTVVDSSDKSSSSFSKSASFFANLQSHAQAEISGIVKKGDGSRSKNNTKTANVNYKL